MKKIITIFFVFLSLVLSVPVMADGDSTYTVPLDQETDYDSDLTREGRRIPSRPMMCTITPNGIQSPLNPTDIISYEIWDETDEICLVASMDEMACVNYIYTHSGDFILRIITESRTYIGYLSLNSNK